MKRLLCIFVLLLLLAGCSEKPQDTTVLPTNAPTTAAPTVTTAPDPKSTETAPTEPEPTISWIETVGKPWDVEGSLVELPLSVPNGLVYSAYIIYDGDLLLWTDDSHRPDHPRTELCLIDLDSGEVMAQADIPISVTLPPQPLDDSLYLVDCRSGLIVEMDKSLQVAQQWQTEIRDGSIYMGSNATAYIHIWGEDSYVMNLETGDRQPILEENPVISHMVVQDGYLNVEYYHIDTGEVSVAILDLHTGQRMDLQLRGVSRCEYVDGTWLTVKYIDSTEYTSVECTVLSDGAEPLMADIGFQTLHLLEKDLLYKVNEEYNRLSLHDLSGKSLAECIISELAYSYGSYEVLPCKSLGGYFVVLNGNDQSIRLLHWDPSVNQPGEDIPFAPIPEPTEQELQLQSMVEALEREYGLNILVGTEASTYFYDFQVDQVTDWDRIMYGLDTLEDTLNDYPPGFFRQLRYGEVNRIEIHMVGTIYALDAQYVDSYVAFVSYEYNSIVMVVDVSIAYLDTYYHEFSHMIDRYLDWDAMNREDALFSEDIWCGLNPHWFPGYTYDYSWRQDLQDHTSFTDDYSTITPSEDRARIMQFAMVEYGGYYFEEGTVLMDKLEYYCRCIRDAFDTTGWPDELLWEQYLP